MALQYKRFQDVNLQDPFFDSLKSDYKEFSDWFTRKASERAYVFENDDGSIQAFLYLKIEDGEVADVSPPLPPARRLKVGTLKINPHGTRLGERFIKKVFDHAVQQGVTSIYVTAFDKHAKLIEMFERYGFEKRAEKTTANGTEWVLLKDMLAMPADLVARYPRVALKGANIYLLSLYPEWHTRLLPDSILRTESEDIVQDVSHTNSIHKVYLAAMKGMENLRPGDVLLIYRTGDQKGSAEYRSVVTSVGVIEEYRNIQSFPNEAEFLNYCSSYSIFTEQELRGFWKHRKYPHVIRFTYNFALKKRLNRHTLIEEVGLNRGDYFGFLKLTHTQFQNIIARSEVDASLVVN